MTTVHVIGAGLAGSEAVHQLTKRGIPVILHEMRPVKSDAAHKTSYYAELVCSNSLRAGNIENAVGLLKEEMRRLGSLIMEQADKHAVPAGGALAVDREGFAQGVTQAIQNNPLVTIINEEVTDLDSLDGYVIVASGPLTSEALFENIQRKISEGYLHFFDAAAPIVEADSINYDLVYRASRYDKGGADYLNCPFYTKEEYLAFWEALKNAESAPVKDFEHNVFEACMPIEEMALRGEDTMRYGPLKPVGLVDKRVGKEAYAVVQLRQDNAAASLYNLVGFQTHLKWGEQKRVFGMIPGLENAEFVRYGVMHKNTYMNSPKLLNKDFSLRKDSRFYFAGQMTGVEGYVESAASGLMAGLACARKILGEPSAEFPAETAHGSLANYVSNPPLAVRIRKKKEKNPLIAARALEKLGEFQENYHI